MLSCCKTKRVMGRQTDRFQSFSGEFQTDRQGLEGPGIMMQRGRCAKLDVSPN